MSDARSHDDALVDRCLVGDPGAWEALVGRFGPLLKHRLAVVSSKQGVSLPSGDLDDILSKVWEDLLQDEMRLLKSYAPGTHLDRWLFTIAIHRMLSWNREQGRHALPAEPGRLSLLAREIGVSFPERVWAERENAERLQAAIRRLPSEEQFAIRVFYWFGWPYKRIAQTMEVPVNRVGPLLYAARKRLETFLRDANFLIFF